MSLESESTHAYNFNCLIETKGLVKVTGSHIVCNVSEMVQDRDVVTACH